MNLPLPWPWPSTAAFSKSLVNYDRGVVQTRSEVLTPLSHS